MLAEGGRHKSKLKVADLQLQLREISEQKCSRPCNHEASVIKIIEDWMQ